MGRMPLVRVRGPLKQLADGQAEHELDGGSVAALLRAFEQAHPGLRGWILDERGEIRRHINVFVNGEQGAAQTPVAAGDRVDVLPAISGG
jgi:sulfur-carrier protein